MAAIESLFLKGIALRLHAASLGVYKATGQYAAGETGIVFDAVPQDPDDLITLSAYQVSDDPAASESILGLQVRTRAAGQHPDPARDLAADIFDNLHGLSDTRLPAPDGFEGIWLVQCLRRSQVPGGQDDNLRWSNIQNFYATVHYPSTHRI